MDTKTDTYRMSKEKFLLPKIHGTKSISHGFELFNLYLKAERPKHFRDFLVFSHALEI